MNKRENGTISKWFDKKGYGFISFDGYDRDVFVHISSFKKKGIKSEKIKVNERIECKIAQGKKGLECKDVIFLKNDNISRNKVYSKKKSISRGTKERGKFYLPVDTKEILDLKICDNLNLIVNKYPEFDKDIKADIKTTYEYIKNKNQKENYKIINNIYIKRLRKMLDTFQDKNYLVEKRKYKIDWRLAIGLGEASVYETSIKLHHIYGFPFIPASTFKGTVRSWVINNYYSGEEDEALEDDIFSYVFGSPKKKDVSEKKGNIVFFDVYPIHSPNIEFDIINTHYSDYYQNGMTSPPGDYENPNLVNFLTVKDTTFEFTYGYNKDFIQKEDTSTKFHKEINETINQWIDEVLNYQGIGAKTSAGYGYFTSIDI